MKSLFCCTLVALLLFACKETKTETPVVNTTQIPVMDFTELETAYLEVENDTTYVVNFWATWCKPCVKELPAFEALREAHKADKLKVVLVSLDFPEKLEAGVIPFIEKRGIESDVVLLDDPDANTWIPQVSDEWSGAIPATVIVTKTQKKFYERSFTYDELEKEITSL